MQCIVRSMYETDSAVFRRDIYGLMQVFTLHDPAINGYQKILSISDARKCVGKGQGCMHVRNPFHSFFNAMLLWLPRFSEQHFRSNFSLFPIINC